MGLERLECSLVGMRVAGKNKKLDARLENYPSTE